MKLLSSVLTFFSAMVFVAAALTSCDTTKNMSKQNVTMIVLLQKKYDGTYLEETYSIYKPSDIKKSNRTLNQYRVKFNCTAIEEAELLKKLKDDPKVIEFSKTSKDGLNIQSGTNQKSSKTTSIRKNRN